MQKKIISVFISALFVTFLSGSHVLAQGIDFETVPGVGVPTPCLEISNQYQSLYGITFSLEGGGYPKIAQVGSPLEAFYGFPNNTTYDTLAPGQSVGTYFLTDNCVVDTSAPPLIISYNPPTAAASGLILDVDLSEEYTIQARDAGNNVIQTVTIKDGDPGTGDGVATPWSFNLGGANIYSIRISGVKPQGTIGLGFDNFYARSAAPPPPTSIPTLSEWGMIIFSLLLAGSAIWMMRRRQVS